jgi:hypothetical protein
MYNKLYGVVKDCMISFWEVVKKRLVYWSFSRRIKSCVADHKK